ncbi:uncharacterized protein JN550_000725 [Neoarthrinium moseri]|uniref:uncharacterized protein n=1 Tax=Neoarthrinium moseri TaxID=1658444 RepID=UPI001FDC4231|nr:uncharacterized protein JN550_000725 [Neoarthrinium moseri]KAI1878543.1 hypothetical protein JN550_000725 [Neoarthrinium moseri]
MSPPPSTPVKVPSSAATYTPATLDTDLRSQINSLLIKDGHIEKIQETLLHSLNSHPSNWPTNVQQHALQLLRSGEVSTFPALIRRVLEDVRHDMQAKAGDDATKNGTEVNGATTNGKSKAVNGTSSENSLAIPSVIVDDVLKVARESLGAVCEIDEAGS